MSSRACSNLGLLPKGLSGPILANLSFTLGLHVSGLIVLLRQKARLLFALPMTASKRSSTFSAWWSGSPKWIAFFVGWMTGFSDILRTNPFIWSLEPEIGQVLVVVNQLVYVRKPVKSTFEKYIARSTGDGQNVLALCERVHQTQFTLSSQAKEDCNSGNDVRVWRIISNSWIIGSKWEHLEGCRLMISRMLCILNPLSVASTSCWSCTVTLN
jgi:hypothetical protein